MPADVSHILYLDVDTIIDQSIREFYETISVENNFAIYEDKKESQDLHQIRIGYQQMLLNDDLS